MSEDADVDYMMVLHGEVRELRTENAKLRAALEPFARIAKATDDATNTNNEPPIRPEQAMITERDRVVTMGDLRRAYEALE
jgi:hypothetical protein